ncbi:T9SS type A sorting domain-containing protein [Pontibacter sp. G13]|uniref:T9SS type A sorting domain-containing protein n=1 Tax=Pontibacter sp. G13 TaxID=3074898 RepID=UPI00288B3541|nr:hypothetical protein [Pontibacter sp. G13]WNJ20093.1 hypothetical protein RJD25_06375 [Pontibacter sp. G13]
MKRLFVLCMGLMLAQSSLQAQIVETVAGPSPRFNNGVLVAPDGTIYASDLFGTGFNGDRIHKLSPDGTGVLFAQGLLRPAGMAFDAQGRLFVAEFGGGMVSWLDTAGNWTLFANGLNQPADVAFDSLGNLYVSNYGDGTVSRFTPSGMEDTFASGLGQPVGLAFDTLGVLHVASLNTGRIYRLTAPGAKELLATIPDTPIGFMDFARGGLYVAATGHHRIYQVAEDGTVSMFAGTGAMGETNGALDSAQFTSPDGVAASPTGDTLYISENTSNLLRRIIFPMQITLSSDWTDAEYSLYLFPNPAHHLLQIGGIPAEYETVEMQIYDLAGRLVWDRKLVPVQSGVTRLKVEGLPVGQYGLRVYGRGKVLLNTSWMKQ